jgi:DNA invertase Pin-like site-specific DNA recombinase
VLTFAYCRVSTGDQETTNQLHEMQAAGYEPTAVYQEQVSGSIPAADRPEFRKLSDAIAATKPPKRLVVSKLDRLGRDTADILATVKRLEALGCGVVVLALGTLDLTTPAGKLVMITLAGVAELERDLLRERTHAGLERAKAEGKRLGRPKSDAWKHRDQIKAALDQGESISALARQFGCSRASIHRVRDATTSQHLSAR